MVQGWTDMDIRQLLYFVTIVDKGTVTAAAEALHLSQPPLSTQIHSLEQELGCSLFDRTARHMQLTDAGRALYERARDILDLCESTKNELADMSAGREGTLRLGVVSSICNTVFFAWLKQFCVSRDRLRFELYEANTYQLLEKVRSNRVELAFVRTPFSAPDLSCVRFASDPLCAVGQPRFFSSFLSGADSGTVSLGTLADIPLLIYRRWEQILMDAFRGIGSRAKIFCISDDARTTVGLAEAGFGVGIVPQSVLSTCIEAECRVIDYPGFQTDICAVYRKDMYISFAAKQFLETVQKMALEQFPPHDDINAHPETHKSAR